MKTINHMEAIHNTMEASGLTLFIAGIFGKRSFGLDEYGIHMIFRTWRGKVYFVDFTPPSRTF